MHDVEERFSQLQDFGLSIILRHVLYRSNFQNCYNICLVWNRACFNFSWRWQILVKVGEFQRRLLERLRGSDPDPKQEPVSHLRQRKQRQHQTELWQSGNLRKWHSIAVSMMTCGSEDPGAIPRHVKVCNDVIFFSLCIHDPIWFNLTKFNWWTGIEENLREKIPNVYLLCSWSI